MIFISNGDEKLIYFKNPTRKELWLALDEASYSTPNSFSKKTILCVQRDQSGIMYYELLKPDETTTIQRYHQQMINLNHVLIEDDRNRPENMTSDVTRQ